MAVDRETLLQQPAMAPPPGIQANFDDPYNLRSSSLARNVSIMIISNLAVWMRLFTKFKIVRKLHVEDYFIFISWTVLMFAVEVPSLLLQRTKLGAHQWDITIGELITQVYYFHIADSFYCIGTLFLKTGITVQCLRLFCLEKTSRLATYLLRTLLWINILLYLVSAGVIGFPCSPVRKTWDVTVEGHCINEFVTAFVMAIINTISDLLLVIIPLRALWTLSWDMKRKLRVSTLFAIGLGACICAITRLAPSWSLYRSDDKTYYLELNGALGVLEYFFGLCAACFPVLPKFLKYVVDHSPLVGFRNGTSKLPDVEENKCEEQARGEKPQIVSDVEFHELVNGGDTLGSESGTKVRHDSGGTRREVGVAHKDKGPAVQEHAP